MNKPLEPHPIADELPMMGGDEFEALKEDIQENGQREPILLFEGKILDGRNRYEACRQLGKKPITKEFPGDYEAARRYSASANLTRRHLTKSQQAMVVVRSGLAAPPNGPNLTGAEPIRRAAERYGVNYVTIYKAFYVYERSKELAEQVLQGKLSVGRAEAEIREQEGGDAEPRESPVAATIRRLSKQVGELPRGPKKKRALELLNQLNELLDEN